MTVLLALASALAYGAADFLGGLASRRSPAIAVVVWSQLAGFAVLAVGLPLLGIHAHLPDLLWGGSVGVAGAAAILLLYRGLAVGTMSIVSPITAALAAAIPVVFALVRGERPSLLALGGIGCALAAVVLVSVVAVPEDPDAPLVRAAPHGPLPPGIAEALGAGVAFGFFFIALAQTDRASGLVPLFAARIVSLTLLAGGALVARRSLRIARPGRRVVIISGLLDMSANVLYVLAAQRGSLAIVAVLTSLYPASTVGLAAAVVRERLTMPQWLGVGLALAGVVAISAG